MVNRGDLQKVFEHETEDSRLAQSKIGCLVALFFMPLGAIVDWVTYPDQLAELSTVRFASVILILAIFPLHFVKGAKRHIKPLNLSYPMVIVIAMCVIIMMTDGISGPYYAGLSMLILGVSLLLPLTFPEACFFVLYTIFCYMGFGFFWEQENLQPVSVFNNLYFLCSTGLIATVASYFAERARIREFQLTYELDQRNRELAELDRIKSNFYANISHEFRTPLTLILAPIEDLLASDLNAKSKNALKHIRDNAYRLLKLVNDLLDVQKLEEKKDFLEQQPVRLNSLLANITSTMQALAERKSINLEYVPATEELVVMGDQSALEKVFINLINNAVKFTEPGGAVRVKVSSSESQCLVEVTDTGPGISEHDLPYIFERFRQADGSDTRKHQGTGLGLALVKELTQLHEGNIQVESELGSGTRMQVNLPVYRGTLAEAESLERDIDPLQQFHRAADQMVIDEFDYQPNESTLDRASLPRLLIVEDEPGIREYLSEIFADDYQVTVAKDGAEGLYQAQQSPVDLIILDWMLPKMDGLSICRAIKEDRQLSRIKVLLLTAKSDEKSKLDALANGTDDFLTKPFSTVEIKSRIHNLWNTAQLQRDVEQQNQELQTTLSELKNTQGQLIQSEKLNALGRLSAGLLHEVNNPLSFAFATFQLLEREDSIKNDEYASELMKDIREGMERISQIVKDLKAFAYPETSDLQSEFSLKKVAESAIRFTAAKSSQFEIRNEMPDWYALGSQSHIVQVIVNLVENSVDAMLDTGVESPQIILSAKRLENGRIQVRVTDNGPGIPKEIQNKIFDPFYTTKDVGAGLGMGLSICHTIVSNHAGALAIESSDESGTVFTFDLGDSLPRAKDIETNYDQVSGELN